LDTSVNSLRLDYRPDIDGLRAVAILSVIIYHAFPSKLPGGFIGVDIFFVISGYLISSIVFYELQLGTFSISEFYRRRIRRLFPSLILVLTASLIIGWFCLLAEEYALLGLHVQHAATFTSNFLLLKEVNYFDEIAEAKPLLHLWSLGIEEQFYLFWPLLILSLYKEVRLILGILITLLALSFSANISLASFAPSEAFYMPYARFWELLVGGAYALYERSRIYQAPTDRQANQLGLLGLGLTVSGFIFARPSINFPGWAGLLPVLGAVAIIAASKRGLINRAFLSSKIMVTLGLLSYPLYLWHWPLISFTNILYGETPPPIIRFFLILLAVLLAFISYRLIEKPLRTSEGWRYPRLLIVLMIGLAVAGSSIHRYEGLKDRENAITVTRTGDIGHLEFYRYISDRYLPCQSSYLASSAMKWGSFVRCAQSRANSNPDLIILGDSHAEHLFIGLAGSLPTKNVTFYIQNGSPFLKNLDFESAFRAIGERGSAAKVVLAVDWASRIRDSESRELFEQRMSETIQYLNKHSRGVALVHGLPSFSFSPQRCKTDRWPFKGQMNCAVDEQTALKGLQSSARVLETLREKGLEFEEINLMSYFCVENRCGMAADQSLLFRDKTHLNILGSQYVGRMILGDYLYFFK